MQLAPARTDEEVLESYVGGEIVLSTVSNKSLLVRGTLLGYTMNSGWVSAHLTCREYAAGDLTSIDQAVWQQSTDRPTYALLIARMHVDKAGVLIFTERTPHGTMAIVTLLDRVTT